MTVAFFFILFLNNSAFFSMYQSGVLQCCLVNCYMAGATRSCCRLSARSVYTMKPCTSLQSHFMQSHMHTCLFSCNLPHFCTFGRMTGIFYVLLSLIVFGSTVEKRPHDDDCAWQHWVNKKYCHGQPAWCLLHVILKLVTADCISRAKAAG